MIWPDFYSCRLGLSTRIEIVLETTQVVLQVNNEDSEDIKKALAAGLLAPYAMLVIFSYIMPTLVTPLLHEKTGQTILATTACWNILGIYLVTRSNSLKWRAILVPLFTLPMMLAPFVVSWFKL